MRIGFLAISSINSTATMSWWMQQMQMKASEGIRNVRSMNHGASEMVHAHDVTSVLSPGQSSCRHPTQMNR